MSPVWRVKLYNCPIRAEVRASVRHGRHRIVCSGTASGDDDDGFAGWRWLVLFRQKHSSSSSNAPIFQDPRELDRLSAGGWPGFCVPIQSVAVSTQIHTHTRTDTRERAREKTELKHLRYAAHVVEIFNQPNVCTRKTIKATDATTRLVKQFCVWNSTTNTHTRGHRMLTRSRHTPTHTEKERAAAAVVVADKHRTQSSGKVVVHQRRARSECA